MANVTEPEVFMKQVGDILGDEFVDGKYQPSLDVASIDEANLKREKIGQQQEQLRQINEEIDNNMDYIHYGYEEASDSVKPTDPSFMGDLFGRRGKDVKQQKRNLSHGEEIALEPFNKVQLTIDELLTQLDDANLTLTNYMNENK